MSRNTPARNVEIPGAGGIDVDQGPADHRASSHATEEPGDDVRHAVPHDSRVLGERVSAMSSTSLAVSRDSRTLLPVMRPGALFDQAKAPRGRGLIAARPSSQCCLPDGFGSADAVER